MTRSTRTTARTAVLAGGLVAALLVLAPPASAEVSLGPSPVEYDVETDGPPPEQIDICLVYDGEKVACAIWGDEDEVYVMASLADPRLPLPVDPAVRGSLP